MTMRKRMFVLGAIALLALVAAASAADLNGKWKGDMKMPDGGSLELNFTFHVDGGGLAGTVVDTYGEEQIAEGSVKGDGSSFFVMAGGGRFKLACKGQVVGEDDNFHVTIGDIGKGDVTAKRVP